jgi:hypothetical protein
MQTDKGDVMARELKLLCYSALLLSLALSASAEAQNFDAYLKEKYDIEQQRANTDRIRAETERVKAESEARSAGLGTSRIYDAASARAAAGRKRSSVPQSTDDFAGKKVPKYRLPNGVTLQASGGFHPSEGTVCTSDCFVPLQPR